MYAEIESDGYRERDAEAEGAAERGHEAKRKGCNGETELVPVKNK